MRRYSVIRDSVEGGAMRLRFTGHGEDNLSTQDVHALWKSDDRFCAEFSGALAETPMTAFFWETPVLTAAALEQPFSCVLTPAPSLAIRRADPKPFAEQLAAAPATAGVIAFASLNGDADLVVPRRLGDADCAHLASFLRTAPPDQIREAWRLVAQTAGRWLTRDQPCWISTAGLGVTWLHIRIDSRPKYYVHAPYRKM